MLMNGQQDFKHFQYGLITTIAWGWMEQLSTHWRDVFIAGAANSMAARWYASH